MLPKFVFQHCKDTYNYTIHQQDKIPSVSTFMPSVNILICCYAYLYIFAQNQLLISLNYNDYGQI